MDKNDNVENVNNETTENSVEISNEVVTTIAGVAISGIEGVAEMSGGFASGITEVFSNKKNLSKGIKVDINDENKSVKIDVNIIACYGARIPDVAFNIQKAIKTAVENMTGLKVMEVNVHVQGVSTNQELKKDNKAIEAPKEVKTETKKTNNVPKKK